MRAIELPSGSKVILSDTVGFISDLPHQLVAAFRATLEEVLAADLIVHVRDISHPDTTAQAQDVENILASLGVDPDTPRFEVWNKIDRLLKDEHVDASQRAARNENTFAMSALTGEGIPAFLDALASTLDDTRLERVIKLSFAQGRERGWLYDQGVITSERQTDTGYELHVLWTPRQEKRFRDL